MQEFEAFARGAIPRLLRLAYLLTGNRQDAEDLIQDSMLKLQRSWLKMERVENTEAYARKLLTNEFLQHKRRKVLKTLNVDTEDLSDMSAFHEETEDRIDLRRALSTLPTRQRTAVVLRYYERLTVDEISGVMEIAESSVRSALSRGLDALRKHYHPIETSGYNSGGSPYV